MKTRILKYTDIASITADGIAFRNHDFIVFTECIKNNHGSRCIAERDITASPAYFEFYTPDASTRIVFCKKGLLSVSRNRKDFLHLQKQILSFGYTTYDLS